MAKTPKHLRKAYKKDFLKYRKLGISKKILKSGKTWSIIQVLMERL